VDKRFEHIEDIVAKYLAEEATPVEIEILMEWRKASPENENKFLQFNKIFTESSSLKNIVSIDTDAAWIRLQNRLKLNEEKTGKVIPIKGRKQFSLFIRIAAVLLLAAGLGTVFYFLTDRLDSNFIQVATTDSTKEFLLPDGSNLTLNQNSSVAYKSGIFSRERRVKLKGEAFFNVVHDTSSTFIVEVGKLEIKDIGTAFNVKAIEGTGLVIVSVFEGEVQITTAESNSLFLKAGEEATYDVNAHSLEKSEKIDKNISAYKDKIFIFENADIATVIMTLNEIYSVNLELNPAESSIRNCRITVTFNNESIEIIAETIAETLGLELVKENNRIIFSGNGCK
jgi:ferric-dicitrate binding protein FerR (iron transport regulator)